MINKNKTQKTSLKNHNINLYPNSMNKQKKKKRRTKRRKVSICLSTPENKKTQISRILPQRNLFLTDLGRKRKRERIIKEDLNPNINNLEIIRPGLEINNNKNIIIIDKNILNISIYNNFSNTNSKFKKPTLDLNLINNSPRFLSQIPTPNYQNTNNTSLQFPNSNLDEKYYYLYYDNQLQISPMNINNMILYPPSTRNLFYLDLSSTFEPQKNKNGTYNNINTVFSQTPIGKKEINLSNKILIDSKKFINFDNNIHLFNNDDFSSEINNITLINNNNIIDNLKNQTNSNQKKFPPQIDLNIINQSETNNLFMDSLNISNMKNNNFFNGNINNNNIFNLSPISAFTPRIQNDKT